MSREPKYRIGEVATLTGVSIDSIRAWEKRYQAVAPARDEGNIRLYSESDVSRLKLMQQLVDRGARISDIAGLQETELKERFRASGPSLAPELQKSIPLVLVGNGLQDVFNAMSGRDFRIVAALNGDDDLANAYIPAGATVVIRYEMAALDRIKRVIQQVFNGGARMILLLYHFAPSEILEELRRKGVMTMRMTTDAAELRHALLSRHYWDYAGRSDAQRYLSEPVPASRLTDDQLIRARNISSALACECPSHLAELIAALKSFERYSAQCESASAQDAATHAMLRSASGHARATMETALLQLARDDGLLDQLLGE